MNQEMDWEEYEKILMQRPGFKKALNETRLEYDLARKRIIEAMLVSDKEHIELIDHVHTQIISNCAIT